MRKLYIIIFLFTPLCVVAQSLIDSSWVEGDISIGFEKDVKSLKIKKIPKGEVQIVFREGFLDSVIIGSGTQILSRHFVVSDTIYNSGSSNTFFNVNLKLLDDCFLFILLPRSKRFIKVKVRNDYKVLHIFRYKDFWKVNFTNNMAIYE